MPGGRKEDSEQFCDVWQSFNKVNKNYIINAEMGNY
jgi:hypothetical protein